MTDSSKKFGMLFESLGLERKKNPVNFIFPPTYEN